MNEQDILSYNDPSEFTGQQGTPFETGIGGNVGAELHIDGTPMRLAVFALTAILVLVIFQQGGFRFHVTV